MHQSTHRSPKPRPVTLEVDGEPQGVAVPAEAGVRFLAVRLRAFPIDGAVFDSVEAARAALVRTVHHATALEG